MPIDLVLVVSGVALLSSAAGVVVGARSERRRLVRGLPDQAQAWLDQHSST
ncbi:MAG TPA: hypothetical protein VHM89_06610 [Acidimicrobiales bacterium]|nr:hypothetical protein [Acidimicrobiales bacterium]